MDHIFCDLFNELMKHVTLKAGFAELTAHLDTAQLGHPKQMLSIVNFTAAHYQAFKQIQGEVKVAIIH